MKKAIADEKEWLKTQPLVDRIKESMALLDTLKQEQIQVAMLRTGAIREALSVGWTQRDLAKELGITHGRVAQLAAYGPGRLK